MRSRYFPLKDNGSQSKDLKKPLLDDQFEKDFEADWSDEDKQNIEKSSPKELKEQVAEISHPVITKQKPLTKPCITSAAIDEALTNAYDQYKRLNAHTFNNNFMSYLTGVDFSETQALQDLCSTQLEIFHNKAFTTDELLSKVAYIFLSAEHYKDKNLQISMAFLQPYINEKTELEIARKIFTTIIKKFPQQPDNWRSTFLFFSKRLRLTTLSAMEATQVASLIMQPIAEDLNSENINCIYASPSRSQDLLLAFQTAFKLKKLYKREEIYLLNRMVSHSHIAKDMAYLYDWFTTRNLNYYKYVLQDEGSNKDIDIINIPKMAMILRNAQNNLDGATQNYQAQADKLFKDFPKESPVIDNMTQVTNYIANWLFNRATVSSNNENTNPMHRPR